jgi:hypothetical protein
MTHFERFQLRKSYNPDLTEISEIDRTNKEIQFAMKDFNENSNDWSSTKVQSWCDILRDKKEYIRYLKSLL